LPFAFCFSEGCFGAPKTDIIVAVVSIVVVAIGARHVVWIIVPRATTQNARLAPARKAIVVYCFLSREFQFFKKIFEAKIPHCGIFA
jgi:hypothetical protein